MIDAESFLVVKDRSACTSLQRETDADDADESDGVSSFSIINLKPSSSTDKRLAVLRNKNGSIALVEQPGGHVVQTIYPEMDVSEVNLKHCSFSMLSTSFTE